MGEEAQEDLPVDEESLEECQVDEEAQEDLPMDEKSLEEFQVNEEAQEDLPVDEEKERVTLLARWRRPRGWLQAGLAWWPCSAWPGRRGLSWGLSPMTVPTAPAGSTPIPCWSQPPEPPMRTTTRWSAPSSARLCR